MAPVVLLTTALLTVTLFGLIFPVQAAQRRLFVPAVPQNLDMALLKNSSKKNWRVAIAAPKKFVSGQFENMEICFETDKRFFVETPFPQLDKNGVEFLMPQHGHGLQLEFAIKSLGPEKKGCIALEGVKFHMAGWWQVRLSWRSLGEDEDVTFNLMVK